MLVSLTKVTIDIENNLFPQHIKENMDKCTVLEYVMKTKNR